MRPHVAFRAVYHSQCGSEFKVSTVGLVLGIINAGVIPHVVWW